MSNISLSRVQHSWWHYRCLCGIIHLNNYRNYLFQSQSHYTYGLNGPILGCFSRSWMSPGSLILWKQHIKFCIYIHLLNLLERTNTMLGVWSRPWERYQCPMWHHKRVISRPGYFRIILPKKMEVEEVKDGRFSYEFTDKLKTHGKVV